MNKHKDVWPIMHPEGFNFDGSAIDYIAKCVQNTDDTYNQASAAQIEGYAVCQPKIEEFEKTLSSEQKKLFNELYDLISSTDGDFVQEQFNRALKLGIKLGAECGSCFGKVGIY